VKRNAARHVEATGSASWQPSLQHGMKTVQINRLVFVMADAIERQE
jgi:hypothetical protein